MNGKKLRIFLYGILIAVSATATTYYTLPVHRIGMHSELIMLGDLNGDHAWDEKDVVLLHRFLANPYARPRLEALKVDANRNGFIDDEDIRILERLYAVGDPYKARTDAIVTRLSFPYPREFFLYLPSSEYTQRPTMILDHPALVRSPLPFLRTMAREPRTLYRDRLQAEVYDEGLRFSIAYGLRRANLLPVEREYVLRKLKRCEALWSEHDLFPLLMMLIELSEDAETLTVKGQTHFVAGTLIFRDHLRELQESPLYREYSAGRQPTSAVFRKMSDLLRRDLGLEMNLETLAPPRDMLKLRNYSDRAVWQYFKSTTTRQDFMKLSLFAQHDRRYLRAVARTTPKHADMPLENHNLPMVLLYREAMRIKPGDKRAAVGLLDEAVRIPFAWVKSIPRTQLPSSIALENFLLPGNKEDGPDKSRHWNVFGGIAIYKSPEESVRLALAREVKDYREEGRNPAVMSEFIRDTMANLNGVYHIMTINPHLLYGLPADE
ncbi:MAG: hypothetical protein A2X40_07050 [Elusimicrobia bacterium GWC2_65_9]|nr:MAG: hypothetical protein A2X37_06470 [Elusimicrobia bacterium GWA2_66_18]OGR72339.1 MAG: hypothetical protein A2X40_07050 [Elusimicrobia bacterium GWC2_65_9]